MANTFNYAEKYSPNIIEIINQGALTSPFITSNVEWTGAKTFHFTQMSTSGFKAHSRNGGWNKGTISQTDKDYTVTHDRDISFLVDKADVDETARTAAVEKVSQVFVQTQQIPEVDCYTFSKIADYALNGTGLVKAHSLSDYTADNVYSNIVKLMGSGKLKYYRQRGSLVCYVVSEIMDLLAISKEKTLNINSSTLTEDGIGVETRITNINGVPLIEVIATERMKTLFDYTDGCVPDDDAMDINILFASVETVKTVPKISSIYYFNAGQHTEGDGDLYQNRSFMDTFVFPNGIDGKIDSILVDIDVPAYVTSNTYNTGDVVKQNNEVYKAKEDSITGAFTEAKWDKIS